jgi:hypothetical protein
MKAFADSQVAVPEWLRSDSGSGTSSPFHARLAPCRRRRGRALPRAAWESASQDSEGTSAQVATNSSSSTDQVTR